MSIWRLALSPRWLGYFALACVFAVVCCALGMWQFARRAEAQTEIARIDANYDAEPVPIADALPGLDSFDASQKWLQVEVTGTYLADEQVLARNRPRNGTPGFEVLTPLRLADGSVFIVDRGWLPTGSEQDYPDVVPEPPTGTIDVVVRLKAGEPVLANRGEVPGQVASVQLDRLEELVEAPTYTGAYGLLVSESPAPASAPYPALRPERDEGPHLSYALQWFVFALLGFIGLGWAIRQEVRGGTRRDEDGAGGSPGVPPARRRRSDAEVEDEILDAAR